jgi:AraC-like DNA-binding protein
VRPYRRFEQRQCPLPRIQADTDADRHRQIRAGMSELDVAQDRDVTVAEDVENYLREGRGRGDLGVAASNHAARRLVAAPYRSGGQAQYVPRSVPEPLGERFGATREWALRQLGEHLSLDILARQAGVSPRTFSRRFVEETGCTPMQWVMRARIDLARELLERSQRRVEQMPPTSGSAPARTCALTLCLWSPEGPGVCRSSRLRPGSDHRLQGRPEPAPHPWPEAVQQGTGRSARPGRARPRAPEELAHPGQSPHGSEVGDRAGAVSAVLVRALLVPTNREVTR